MLNFIHQYDSNSITLQEIADSARYPQICALLDSRLFNRYNDCEATRKFHNPRGVSENGRLRLYPK